MSHILGIAEKVGIGGLTAVMAKVFVVGQLAMEGVTTMVYTWVTFWPAGMPDGVIMVFWKLPLPQTSHDVGDHE